MSKCRSLTTCYTKASQKRQKLKRGGEVDCPRLWGDSSLSRPAKPAWGKRIGSVCPGPALGQPTRLTSQITAPPAYKKDTEQCDRAPNPLPTRDIPKTTFTCCRGSRTTHWGWISAPNLAAQKSSGTARDSLVPVGWTWPGDAGPAAGPQAPFAAAIA